MDNETRIMISLMAFAIVVGALSTPAAVVLPSIALGMWLGWGVKQMQGLVK